MLPVIAALFLFLAIAFFVLKFFVSRAERAWEASYACMLVFALLVALSWWHPF